MYYRHDWLTKFGQAVPTNWDEMIEFAKYATFNDPDGNGRDDTYGISVYGSTNRGYAYWTFQDWVWQAGGSILREVDDGKWVSNLNTPEVKLALSERIWPINTRSSSQASRPPIPPQSTAPSRMD